TLLPIFHPNRHHLNGLGCAGISKLAAPNLTEARAMIAPVGRGFGPTCVICALACFGTVSLHAQRNDVPSAERARGAEQVVVGHVSAVTPMWRDNNFGDRLIVSVVHVVVEETLKG